MHHITNHTTETTSVLARLRALLPNRQLHLSDALRLAELQANRLLELRHDGGAPIASDIVTGLPGIAGDFDLDMPASGASDWDAAHRQWVITLCASEPDTRHRFTMLHEYKHIIDHGSAGISEFYGPTKRRSAAEIVADYFAACVLMPKRLIKAAYFGHTQTVDSLADLFEVSNQAMHIRLAQLGLLGDRDPDSSASAQRVDGRDLIRHRHANRTFSRSGPLPVSMENSA